MTRPAAGEWPRTWAAWTAAAAASFAVLEAAALRHPERPTFSRTLARWLGCNPPTRRGRIAPAALVGAAVWLAVHVARFGHDPEGTPPWASSSCSS